LHRNELNAIYDATGEKENGMEMAGRTGGKMAGHSGSFSAGSYAVRQSERIGASKLVAKSGVTAGKLASTQINDKAQFQLPTILS
jgi:hypothetical protein